MEFIKNLGELLKTRSDFFIELLLQHLVLSLIAIVIITVVGVTTGVLIAKSQKAASVVIGLTNVLYTIPSIAMFGFFVSITGIGNTTAIIALVIYGLLPVIRNTYVGLTEVDDQILEAAVGMGSTPWQLLSKIQFPLALPVIIAGIRNMVVMTIALAGIASFIGAGGLGVAIWRGITTNFDEMTVAGSLLVALLAFVADGILGIIEKRLLRRTK
ncbi:MULTISPECIES: ABC transporter permease [Acetobacterium]|uniref:ABC transporter permease n=2 Tax=Acetobacterium wieringae TaxID=52694 RepID=A0A5D0WLD4_9FIRM|nr:MULTISPECIES: ABC transporter permease [Acetobacterium]TYC84893.1 ABC transporter permease [Acetobacterium wieringae]HAZ06140.1 ABC transporter permease [Acetobacterium sp.]